MSDDVIDLTKVIEDKLKGLAPDILIQDGDVVRPPTKEECKKFGMGFTDWSKDVAKVEETIDKQSAPKKQRERGKRCFEALEENK